MHKTSVVIIPRQRYPITGTNNGLFWDDRAFRFGPGLLMRPGTSSGTIGTPRHHKKSFVFLIIINWTCRNAVFGAVILGERDLWKGTNSPLFIHHLFDNKNERDHIYFIEPPHGQRRTIDMRQK